MAHRSARHLRNRLGGVSCTFVRVTYVLSIRDDLHIANFIRTAILEARHHVLTATPPALVELAGLRPYLDPLPKRK